MDTGARPLRARGGWYVPSVMPSRPTSPQSHSEDDDALDLPPLDDEGEPTADADELDDDLLPEDDGGDAFDDAVAGGSLDDLLEGEGAGVETGWLLDADDAASLDIGGDDIDAGDEDTSLDDEPHGVIEDDPDLDIAEASVAGDSGEEGPLADDEELREEDLPMLDADDEGDVSDDALFEAGILGGTEELRWDDRAWVRVPTPEGAEEEPEESGMLPVPGLDPAFAARDARWRALEEDAHVSAATFLPGGSVVVAIPAPDGGRVRLVRILPEGDARIIAEVEPPAAEEDEPLEVRALHWDAERGVLLATATKNERHAFRPA